MDDNQIKPEESSEAIAPSPTIVKNIDFKLLATIILLILVSIMAVFLIAARVNKPVPVLPTAEVMPVPITSTEEKLALPDDWLEAVPVTPDAAETEVIEDFGLASSSVTFTTKQTEAEAIAYYKADIVAKGGKITDTLETEAKKIIVANTADGSLYVVYIGTVAGETTITINVNPAQ